ncbi:raptor N-terminal caspase like domain-containing protein [Lactarius vividus]|nr:raptor N-terminal caspase like domain-containing protein [Lactarius vividus]
MHAGRQNGHLNDTDTERGGRHFFTTPSEPSSAQTHPGHGRAGSSELDGRGNESVGTAPDPIPIIPYWSAKRHLTCGNPTPPPSWAPKISPWRSSPGKLKTANAALVLCLNIDVDPPDIVKTNPCAVLECWVDPHTMPSHKALEVIGTNLQHQFEGLSPKLSYKPILDPSYEDLRRFCATLRKQAKEDTVLFYYNGHGVPKPTASGELWCFNRNYTQYIPVSLAEVQHWLGTPCVYIWDCSAAGNLLLNFNIYAQRRDSENANAGRSEGAPPFSESIQLAACAANEQLPSCPELPADLFTSCLTSPIDIALRYFVMHNQLPNNITADMAMQVPGDLKDRRTPLGELNWIFTAITDTIAWTSFSRELFTRLYRSDLLIASLFRNFLLAERIMKNYHCTPHTSPSLPPTNTHPLWAAWDLAVDSCLRQLPELLRHSDTSMLDMAMGSASIRARRQAQAQAATPRQDKLGHGEKIYNYIPSRFFADQLTAFEVWISRGGSALTKRGPLSLPLQNYDGSEVEVDEMGGPPASSVASTKKDHHLVPRKPPEQLPIVLQVLLSQPHRLRALVLLSQFVDLGPWAVHLALAIGIFPYISKLLQAGGQDLRPVLIFIWSRILAVDLSCQVDLYSNGGYKYFANILAAHEDPQHLTIPNGSEHKAMCAFVLAAIARDYPHGQNACWREKVFHSCFERLDEGDFLLRQWSALCIGQMWDGNDDIKIFGVDNGTQDKFISLLTDDSPEVRAAVLFALGTFMGASGSANSTKTGGGGTGTMNHLEERVHFRMEVAVEDASPMVRKELLVLISCLVKDWVYWEEDRRWRLGANSEPREEDVTSQAISEWLDSFGDEEVREENRVILSSFFTIFSVLLELSVDPYHEVATNARTIVDYIMALLLESPFTRLESNTLQQLPSPPRTFAGARSRRSSLTSSPTLTRPSSPNVTRPALNRSDIVTGTIKRTSSFANALKNLAGGIAFPSVEDGRSSPHRNTHAHTPVVPSLSSISRPPSPNLNFAQYACPYSRPPSPQVPTSSKSAPASPTASARSSTDDRPHQATDFLPSDVMEALMEEDMERLRARRRSTHGTRGRNAVPHSPADSTFSSDSTGSSVILGLGTGSGIRDILPLKSRFFDWCCEYFKEPQMRQAEADEPGSLEYNYQAWRQQRNEQVLSETLNQAEIAFGRPWDKAVTTLHIQGVPLSMAFHAYDPHIAIANETDVISVWDWSRRRQLTSFCNGNPKKASITSLQVINQDVGGILLAGSADGMIRLYRNYDPATSNTDVQMVSAFRGLSEIISVRRGSGVVVDWKQAGGFLLVGGDSRIIRVWDAHTEAQLLDLETNSDSPVTAIASERGPSSVLLAGFADGVTKVFDRRLEEEDAVVRSFNEHNNWVQNVRWHPHFGNQFLSASMNGEVKLWDTRGADRAVETWDMFPGGLAAFDVHSQSGVFAGVSTLSPSNWRTQRVVIHSISRHATLSTATMNTGLTTSPTRGFPSQYIPRSSSITFHPTEMLYGVGSPDGTVRIYGSKLL